MVSAPDIEVLQKSLSRTYVCEGGPFSHLQVEGLLPSLTITPVPEGDLHEHE